MFAQTDGDNNFQYLWNSVGDLTSEYSRIESADVGSLRRFQMNHGPLDLYGAWAFITVVLLACGNLIIFDYISRTTPSKQSNITVS